MEKNFQRTVENFICERCGFRNISNGYNNHCSQCLWSKHVDFKPGDRKEICQGLMEPIGIDRKDGDPVIIFKCQKCGTIKKNRTWPNDNYDLIVELSQKPV